MAEGPVGRVGWDTLWLPATVGPAWGWNPPPALHPGDKACSIRTQVGGVKAVWIPACGEMGRQG